MLFFVYMLASQHYGTLYIGSTTDLARRVWEHKTRAVPGFTAKYGVDRLVWFEVHETLESALVRERQIKRWKRDKSERLHNGSRPAPGPMLLSPEIGGGDQAGDGE